MPGPRKPLELHLEARQELQDSVTFYRERGGERLALRFKHNVHAAFETIVANPERNAPTREFPNVRKLRLKHFPFSVLYVEAPEMIGLSP